MVVVAIIGAEVVAHDVQDRQQTDGVEVRRDEAAAAEVVERDDLRPNVAVVVDARERHRRDDSPSHLPRTRRAVIVDTKASAAHRHRQARNALLKVGTK